MVTKNVPQEVWVDLEILVDLEGLGCGYGSGGAGVGVGGFVDHSKNELWEWQTETDYASFLTKKYKAKQITLEDLEAFLVNFNG